MSHQTVPLGANQTSTLPQSRLAHLIHPHAKKLVLQASRTEPQLEVRLSSGSTGSANHSGSSNDGASVSELDHCRNELQMQLKVRFY